VTRPSRELVHETLTEHIEVLKLLASQADTIIQIAIAISRAISSGHKLLVFGNGGSAADAEHMAAELVGRFEQTRAGLPAIALSSNVASVTAISNDYGYCEVFARQIEALGQVGDVAVAITTSGRSENVLLGLKAARSTGLVTVALTGDAGLAIDHADIQLRVASKRTARVQEAHVTAIHCICELVEQDFVR
jgi:D-sedoheptulose 7-phosphate isomerase